MDFSRSIVRIARAEPPMDRPFDGIDILELIETNQPVQKRTLFWRARRDQWTRKAVRHGALKYVSLQKGDDIEEYIFDLDQEPMEKNNLFDKQKEASQMLKLLLKDWEEKVKHKR